MNAIHVVKFQPHLAKADLTEHPPTSNPRANPASDMNKIPFFAAILAFLGVALGAFGAHALKQTLAENGTTGTWETAVFYHLVHAAVAWIVAVCPEKWRQTADRAGLCWVTGVIIFSGSLYLLALGGPRWLGPVTPIGGLLLMAGWGFAARWAWLSSRAKLS